MSVRPLAAEFGTTEDDRSCPFLITWRHRVSVRPLAAELGTTEDGGLNDDLRFAADRVY